MLPYSVAFRMDLAHGHCVGVHLPVDDASLPDEARRILRPEEIEAAATFGPRRRISWYGGRVALRLALSDLGVAAGPVSSNDRGAPVLPAETCGSLSHKDGLAVALVAPDTGFAIGVDVESLTPTTHDVARHVLTEAERRRIDAGPAEARDRAVLLRFSAKEALYKALDPWVGRFVGFKEVEADCRDGGSITFALSLGRGEGPFEVGGTWRVREDHCITTARVRPAEGR